MRFPSLADYPYVIVRVSCRVCPRRGRYRLARLAERYGADCTLIRLLDELSATCERRKRQGERGVDIYWTCQAHLPDMSGGGVADVREVMRGNEA